MGLALFISGVVALALGNAFGVLMWVQGSTGAALGIMLGVGALGIGLAATGLIIGKSKKKKKAPPPPPPPPQQDKPKTAPMQAAAPPPPPPPVPAPMPMHAPVDPAYAQKGRGAVEGPNGYLQVYEGADAGRQLVIQPRTQITIGRAPDNVLPLMDHEVSSYHVTLYCANDRILFQDHGSSNGTFVNDQPQQNGRIQSGDTLQLGRTTKIFFSFK